MRKLVLSALAVLSLWLPAAAHATEPRAVVGRIAEQISANYFDPAKGAAIAASLNAEAARGAYDRFTAPLDLAQALTQRLKREDAHFAVSWRAAAPAPPVAVALRQRADAREADRRANYGFHRVEVAPGNVGVVDLRFFAHFQGPDDPARGAADAAMALVANTDAVIFDLRDNGGGSPAMVGYLVSHFVPEGADIYNTFKSRGPDQYEKPTVPIRGVRRLEVPLYILISGRTGSAAESFAYTLQAAKRAVVVGEASSGGANPGDVIPVGDGFTVFISSGSPVNPITRRNWEGTGVTPDVASPAADALVAARRLALSRQLQARQPEAVAVETRWALEALAPAFAVPARTLTQYAGTYGVREVRAEPAGLVMRHGRRPPQRLKPLAADLFSVEGTAVPIRVKFERDAAGRVTGLVQMTADGAMTRHARD